MPEHPGDKIFSAEEKIPWKCRRLVIGTGTGVLPIMDEVKKEAKRRHVQLLMLPTAEAIEELREKNDEGTRQAAEALDSCHFCSSIRQKMDAHCFERWCPVRCPFSA
ncbi:MAG: hypothetical protein E6J54_31050 [Deltaproteobacteria bacterium]|nr:MAG: hypothetical protein E6J54_31050 [Deltaproteobacteria bacterium]